MKEREEKDMEEWRGKGRAGEKERGEKEEKGGEEAEVRRKK